MPIFNIAWKIDLEADSPEEAVIEARRLQLDSDCTLFSVKCTDGKIVELDSYELMYGSIENM